MQSLPPSACAPGMPEAEHRTFLDLLDCLRINQQQYDCLKLEVLLSGGLNLDRLLGLFTEQDWKRFVFLSLPANSTTSDNLIATNFNFFTLSKPIHRLQDIKSISFEVKAADGAPLNWAFSLDTFCPGRPARTYSAALSGIEVTIEQPASYGRTLQGTYSGTIEGHSICGTFTPDFFRGATVYKTTLSDSFSMADLLGIFGAKGFCYSDRLKCIKVPGLVLEGFAVDEPSLDTSFVVKTIRSKSFLTEVSGGFSSFEATDLGSNWGILKNKSLSVGDLRVVLSCINSSADFQIVFELGGKLEQSIPFRLSAGLWGPRTSFKMTLSSGVSICKLLELTESSDATRDFPVSNLSNKLPISSAAVVWVGHDVNFLSFGFGVDDWTIVDRKFKIQNLSLEIQSTNPFDADEFFLSGSGIVELGGIELEVFVMIQLPFVSFRVASYGRPLSLKSLFRHLDEDGVTFPSGFSSILDQFGIDSMIVEGSHGSHGWSLLRFAMTMGINDQLHISEHIQLSLPSLSIDITDPFHETGRRIQARIDAAIKANVNCDVSIGLIVGKMNSGQSVDDSITVRFHADGVLSLGALLDMFDIQKDILPSMPSDMTFLIGTGLASASATLSHSGGKYSLNDMSVSVVSFRSLLLFDDVVLKNLSLDFNYPMSSGVKFSGDLSFSSASDLKVVLAYDDPSPPSSQPPSPTLGSDNITTGSASWSGEIMYDGKISVPDIISRVSGINIKDDLSSAASGLTLFPGLHNFDFHLSAVIIELKRQLSCTSLTFKANTDFPVIHSLCLKLKKANSWLYYLDFNLSSVSRLPIKGLSLEGAAIIVSNQVDNRSFPIDTKVGNQGLSVALSLTLILDGPLKRLRRVAQNGDRIDIWGAFSVNSVELYAQTIDLALFDHMTLSGFMGVKYINSDLQFVMLGKIKNIKIPDLSSETFEADFSLTVEVPDPEIDFTFQLSRLENAFTFNGLNFCDILFSIGFSEEFPVPSELAVAGQIQFCVGEDCFAGAIALYLDQDSLSHCGVMGSFHICPSFSQALTGFSPAPTGLDKAGPTVPAHVDGTFADLAFQIAPQGFQVGSVVVPQGYRLAGSLNLPSCGFDASFDIEIDISSFRIHVDGYIKNALVFPKNGTPLFALSQASSSSRGPFIDMTITSNSFKCDLSAEVRLLGLSVGISAHISDNGLEIHEFISAWVGGARLDLVANKHMVCFSMSCTLALSFPSFWIGTIEIPAISMVGFSASLSSRLDWSKDTWDLIVTGDVSLMGWHLGTHTFILDANITELEALTKRIAHEIESLFMSAFAMKILHLLENAVGEVVGVLKAIGMAGIHVAKLLVKAFGSVAHDVIKEIGYIFNMAAEDLAPIMKEVGMAYRDAVHAFVQLGRDIDSVTSAIVSNFECDADDVKREFSSAATAGAQWIEHIL